MDAPTAGTLPAERPPFDLRGFMAEAAGFGHLALLGMRYAAQGADWAELAMEPAPLLADADGALAFGPLATLLDTACGCSIWVRSGRFRPHATLDLRIDRLRDPLPGRILTGRGECVQIDGDLAQVRGHAYDGDPARPFALATGTFMVTQTW